MEVGGYPIQHHRLIRLAGHSLDQCDFDGLGLAANRLNKPKS